MEGGLGNQMFQYAFGRRLALDRGVPLKLDISAYSHDLRRTYELQHYQIQAEIASEEDIASVVGNTFLSGRLNALLDRRKP